ncbi:MAG TPA: nuclease-related domain-containing protein [Anaerolineae bacterium]|nr:nuclease-related domain-containing protein [Anaerolineae bacterium]HQH38830.1 nuclease-related domain-containing protein [Anaerolineae bacterium]
MDSRLLDVLQLVDDGQRETALLRLRSYLQAYPEDADAWVVLSGLAPNRKMALSALRRAVQVAPENKLAHDALAALETQVAAPSAPPSSPPHLVVEEMTAEFPDVAAVSETPLSETAVATSVKPSEAGPFEPLAVDSAEETAEAEPAREGELQIIRDARAVVWPFVAHGEKPRPLGALLDENRLTRQDLLWAAKEARHEDIRQASQVILETMHRLADVTMTPEDARLIAWPFRRLNRPLGQLVDAGTVQVKDLRRAAWYAKDARLREAARMMLPIALERREAVRRKRAAQKEQQQTPSEATPQNTSVRPPASAAPGGKAAQPEHARPQVRTPENSTGRVNAVSDEHLSHPMVVIQGADYLVNEVQRRYRQSALVAALIMLLMLAGLFVVVAIMVTAFVHHEAPAVWLWPLLMVLFLPLFGLSDRFVELWQEGQNFRRGQLGESQVARQLRQGLGGDWTLFRNVKLPGSNVDIDMVLLGPPGVFALEVKAYTGHYRYARQYFYRRAMMGWRRMQHNPGKQARAAAKLLHDYITDTLNDDVWVEPRLVWGGPGQLTLQEPEVYVWFLEKLDQETERLRALPPKLSTEKRAALSGLLRGLCSTLR